MSVPVPPESPPPRPSSRQLSEVLSELAEELKCSICLDHFSDPVFLPCHHTFCDACVRSLVRTTAATAAAAAANPPRGTSSSSSSALTSSWIGASSSSSSASASSSTSSVSTSETSSGGEIVCPLCRWTCAVPSGGRSFPINFQMRNLVERIRPLGSFKKCGRCRSRAATVFCFACEHFLCADCDEDEPLHADLSSASEGGSGSGASSVGLAASPTPLNASVDLLSAGAGSAGSGGGGGGGEMTRSDSLPSMSALRLSNDAGTPAPAHVRVPVIDALAILQMRKADAELEAGTLCAQLIPPLVSREQCSEQFYRWLGSSWLLRGSSDAVKRKTITLCFVPTWAWKVETLAAGSIQPLLSDVPHVDARTHAVQFNAHHGSAHCSLRSQRRPVLVCATSEVSGSVLARLEPWDFDKVEKLQNAAPEHPTARLMLTDIAQRDAWPEAERRVEHEAAEELERELRRRAGIQPASAIVGSKSDICVTSKTVRRLWLPVYVIRYVVAADSGEDEEFVCYLNAQSGRAFGERPAVSTSRLLGALGIGLGLVVAPLAAYRLAREGKL